jgi:hypothetical protein
VTHHIWTRVFVTSLLLLGDSAFASEIDHRDDIDAYTGGNIFQISQPALLDDSGAKWQPPVPNADQAGTAYYPAALTITSVTEPVSDTHIYHPFNSRAPPFPAV